MSTLFAFLHHLCAFALVGALAIEFALIRQELTLASARRLLTTDMVYGIAAGALLAIGLTTAGFLMNQLRRPRIAFCDGEVRFYLRGGRPIAVPVEIVEAFFAGQGPAHLPAVAKQPQTVNLVARLSQRHTEWARHEVKPALGSWCDGYVTIRGAWCEPLNGELIRKLNKMFFIYSLPKTSFEFPGERQVLTCRYPH